jgi:hypothetical protein
LICGRCNGHLHCKRVGLVEHFLLQDRARPLRSALDLTGDSYYGSVVLANDPTLENCPDAAHIGHGGLHYGVRDAATNPGFDSGFDFGFHPSVAQYDTRTSQPDSDPTADNNSSSRPDVGRPARGRLAG